MTENDDKNDPSRFLSDGVAFRAKLIGILEVGEARGDRMCQEALQDLKVAIRAAGEHKQRITVHVAIDGLRLRDEKTGDSLYHHPVHKISFIAQDMTDSRAFGYIFGSPDSGHRFFGIKTEKSASQVVIAMRDLFQVVFELKKKEIELARLQIQGKTRLTEPSTNGDSLGSVAKLSAIGEIKPLVIEPSTSKVSPESIADLVDLEQELNSLQRGLNQMERLTPSDGPQSIVSTGHNASDPFGDSFASFTPPPCLPPPPSSRERPTRCVEPPFSPPFSPPPVLKTPFSPTPLHQAKPPPLNLSTKQTTVTASAPPLQENNSNIASSPDWLHGEQDVFDDSNPLDSLNVAKPLPFDDLFTELDPLGTGRSKPYIDKKHFFQELKNPPKKVLRDLVGDYTGSILQPLDNKSNFGGKFSEESSKLVSLSNNSLKDMDPFNDPFDQSDPFVDMTFKPQADPFDTDFVPFKIFNNQQINPIKTMNDSTSTSLTDTKVSSIEGSNEGDNFFNGPLQVSLPPERGSSYIPSKSPKMERQSSTPTTVRNRPTVSKQNTVDSSRRKVKQHIILTQKFSKDGSLPESLDGPPEPPPRPEINSSMPPPLPPKKQLNDIVIRPPPRPPHSDNDSHYDYIDSYNSKITESYTKFEDEEKSPPLPVPARKPKFEDNFIPQRPKKELSEDVYLTPISLLKRDTHNVQVTKIDKPVLLPPPQRKDNVKDHVKKDAGEVKIDTKALDMSLSDLLSCGVEELAKKLNTPAVKITDMTIIQLTNYLKQYLEETKRQSREIAKTTEEPVADNQNNFADFNSKTFEANFDQFDQKAGTYDRYAVFREIQQEDNFNKTFDTKDDSVETNEDLEEENDSKIINNSDVTITVTASQNKTEDNSTDRYAALRSIFITDENNFDEKSLDSTRNDTSIDEAKENIVENDDKNTFDSDLKNVLMQMADDYKTNDNSLSSKFNSTLSVGNDKMNSDIYKSISQPISRNKSPVLDIKSSSAQNKSPVLSKSPVLKVPVTHVVTDSVPNHVRMTSGSLSDVISGSSPEIDNLTGSPDLKKQEITSTSESWAIFDTPNSIPEPPKTINQSTSPLPIYSQTNVETLTIDNKITQQAKIIEGIKTLPLYDSSDKLSENLVDSTSNKNVGSSKKLDEGMSPWSSDGKEFYGSPTEWPQRGANRDERRRRHHRESGWSKPQTSSSSRDASPWDEEGPMDPHPPGPGSVHSELRARRARSRRRDSWDEEEFDYDEESEHPNWHTRRQHGQSTREQIMRSREFLDPRGPPGGSWYPDRPGRTRDDYSDRSLEDLRYERKTFDGRDGFERKSFDRKGGFKNFDRDDRMYYERSRHFGYNRDSCDSYEDRGDFDHWDRQDMYDRHDRDEFKHGGHKMPEHWIPSDRKYAGRYATVGRGADQRRRAHTGREWGSDWGGPSDEWEQDSDPDDRGMTGRYGRGGPGRPWSGDGPVSAGPGEVLDRGVSPEGPPGPPHNRQWKRPASANESDRRLDRKGLHQQIGGSDNERDRRYRTKSRSRSRESQFSDIRPPKVEMNSLTRGRTRHQRFDNVMDQSQIKPSQTHLNNKHYSEYNSIEIPRENLKPKPKFPQSDFDEKDDFDKFDMHAADSKFEADFSQFYNLPPNSRFRDSDPSDKDSPRSLSSDTRKPDSGGYAKATNFKFENDFCEDNDDFDNDNGLKMKVDSKQSFEDDFIPPNLNKPTSRLSENANFESISEEIDEKSDSVGNMEATQNDFNHRNQNKTILQKTRNQTRENLKKSESVNIFARDVDPFDDDDFFKNGSKNSDIDRTGDSGRSKKDLYQDNLKWPSDSKFEVFDD